MKATDGLAGWDGRVRAIELDGPLYAAALYVGGDDDTAYLAQGDKTKMQAVASYLNNLLEDESDERWGFVRHILPRLREREAVYAVIGSDDVTEFFGAFRSKVEAEEFGAELKRRDPDLRVTVQCWRFMDGKATEWLDAGPMGEAT